MKNGLDKSKQPQFAFNTYNDEGSLSGGSSKVQYSFGKKTLEFLRTNKNDNLFKNYINGLDIEFSIIEMIAGYADKIDESEFILLKDGTVIISRLICKNIDNCNRFEIVYPSSEMLLYGDYRWVRGTNFYVGKPVMLFN